MMFGLMATQARFNDIISPFIAMAPVAYFTKMKDLNDLKPFKEKILWLLPRSFAYEYLRILRIPNLCSNAWLRDNLGYLMAKKTASVSQINMDRIPVYIDNVFMGSSTRNLVHLLQQSRGLTFYDFGTEQLNIDHYGTATPPKYNFSQITSKNLVEFHVKNDLLLDLENIKLLKNELKGQQKHLKKTFQFFLFFVVVPFACEYQIPDETWAHTDLILGKDVGKYVNSKILSILKSY